MSLAMKCMQRHTDRKWLVNSKGALKYTPEPLKAMYPPPMWEYSKLPWYLGLAVKVFRRGSKRWTRAFRSREHSNFACSNEA
jgi:hypothetical protein